jgi:hypothetical protein
MSQSKVATDPSSSGLPLCPGRQSTEANLSTVFEAKTPDAAFWLSFRMLIAKLLEAAKTVCPSACLAIQTRTRGGSSDTDVKEFAVKPRGSASGPIAVTMVTPVRKEPSARLNSVASKAVSIWDLPGIFASSSLSRKAAIWRVTLSGDASAIICLSPASTMHWPRGARCAMAADIAGDELRSSDPVMNSAGIARRCKPSTCSESARAKRR